LRLKPGISRDASTKLLLERALLGHAERIEQPGAIPGNRFLGVCNAENLVLITSRRGGVRLRELGIDREARL